MRRTEEKKSEITRGGFTFTFKKVTEKTEEEGRKVSKIAEERKRKREELYTEEQENEKGSGVLTEKKKRKENPEKEEGKKEVDLQVGGHGRGDNPILCSGGCHDWELVGGIGEEEQVTTPVHSPLPLSTGLVTKTENLEGEKQIERQMEKNV